MRTKIRRRSGWVDALDVLGFQPFVAGRDFEGNRFSLIQGFITLTQDGGVMNKNILSRILGNKAEAFFVVEPFHFAAGHNCF